MKRTILLLALTLLSGLSCADLLVTDLVGKAEIEGKGKVNTLSDIPAGNQLRLSEGSRMTAIDTASGNEFALRGPGLYSIENTGPKVLKGTPIETKILPVTNLPNAKLAGGRLSMAALVMRKTTRNNIPVPVSPVNTTVLTTTPLLRWSPVEGATAYHVSLFDEAGAEVFATRTKQTEQPLSAAAKLTHGRLYSWRVEALGPNGRFAEAATQFSVVTEAQSRLLSLLRPGVGDGYGRRVLYALQLQEAGVIEDARAVWKSLADERPDDEMMQTMAAQ